MSRKSKNERLSGKPVYIDEVVNLINDAHHHCQDESLDHLVGATAVLANHLGVSPKRCASMVKSVCEGPAPHVVKGLWFDPDYPHTPIPEEGTDTPSDNESSLEIGPEEG